MYRVVWTTIANLKKKEYKELDEAVLSVISAQFPAKIYNSKKKVVAKVDGDGLWYYY